MRQFLLKLFSKKSTALTNKDCWEFTKPFMDENIELKKRIQENRPVEEKWETYWNNRRPKINQVYKRQETDGTYEIDVRNYFMPFDVNIPIVEGKTNDEKALNALKLVISTIKYTPDKEDYGYDEYWAYPYQTLKRKKGDCEDGAILIANILIRSNVPYWRIRLNAGSVKGGGHCYATYCRETDNQWVILDWCYWANLTPIKDRKKHSDEQNYSDKSRNFYIWFSWNQKYCFGNMDTMASMPKRRFKNKDTT